MPANMIDLSNLLGLGTSMHTILKPIDWLHVADHMIILSHASASTHVRTKACSISTQDSKKEEEEHLWGIKTDAVRCYVCALLPRQKLHA